LNSSRSQLVALAAVFVLISSCSSKAATPVVISDTAYSVPPSVTTTASISNASDAAHEYVKGVTSGNADDAARAVALSAAGSPAALYAAYESVQDKVFIQGGRPDIAADLTTLDNGDIKGCYSAGGSQPAVCYTFGSFVADPTGMLTTLSVNGQRIDDRVTGPSGGALPVSGGTVTVLGALKSSDSSGGLLIAVEIAGGSLGVTVQLPSGSSYIGVDGIQVQPSTALSMVPSLDVASGAKSDLIVGFQKAVPGGTLRLGVCTPTFNCATAAMKVGAP
jgi:hypothetical protein